MTIASIPVQEGDRMGNSFAPLPDFAIGPDIPSSGYLTTDLGGGLYGVTSGLVNTMFLVTKQGVVVLDAPRDLGDRLLTAIGEVTTKPVTHIVYSHAHADHIDSAHLFPGSPTVVAHELTGNLLKMADDPHRPLPNEAFSGRRHVLDLGGERLVLEYPGDFHQPGNLFVHAPDHRVLAVIDSFTVKSAPFFRLLFTSHVPTYTAALNWILDYPFETIVTGHMSQFGTPEDVETTKEYVADLHSSAKRALQIVNYDDAVRHVPAENRQARLKVYVDTVTETAADIMPTSWMNRLGGFDIFLKDNMNVVAWSLLND
ncbi:MULTISPECIES: MBL fold metallo-hydrolase [unclassified Streptomyces]|uniref:MBL fold metallo-hydrolase n=1 Tax=unclassified Streptomyces TaxID=2593676 RepID=UPI0034439107